MQKLLKKLRKLYQKLTNYGLLRNKTDYDCGSIALYNLMKILGRPITYEQSVELPSTQKDVGCLLKDFRETLFTLGINYNSLQKDQAKHFINKRRWDGNPVVFVIAYENKFLDRHMLLYYNNGSEEFLVNDRNKVIRPATPKRMRFLIEKSLSILMVDV